MCNDEKLAYIHSIIQEGREGYNQGFPNPYPVDSQEASAWDTGYYAALHDHEGDACGYDLEQLAQEDQLYPEVYEESPYNGDYSEE